MQINWEMTNDKWKISSGISLIEILVVVAIFAVLGIIVTRSVILTLQGSQKSEGIVAVRENLDFSMSVIERQIRNANSIVGCPFLPTNSVTYMDQNNQLASLSCVGVGSPDAYVASASGAISQRLTSNAISITDCSFSCNSDPTSNQQVSLDVGLTAKSATLTGVQNTTATTNTRIYLRDY